MQTIHAARALLAGGWASRVRVTIGEGGRIAAVEQDVSAAPDDLVLAEGVLLPAPVNLHSHAFQRAMAGMTEGRTPAGRDSFWSWRDLMYRFLEAIGPEDVEAIAAMVMVEGAEAGFGALAEFHYLHHPPGGGHYANVAEMAERVAAAAAETGMGLTLLPVLYMQGGADGRALSSGAQRRFAADRDLYARLLEGAEAALAALPGDARVGVAPHSLRAVAPEALLWAAGLRPRDPVHIHAAEQRAEVAEVEAALGARPVAWLLGEAGVDRRWCVIHATHMDAAETEGLARSGAVAGLCPVTEANLGDGIFPGAAYAAAGGRFGVGSDSNVRISLVEELRQLEYSQRLREEARAVLAGEGSTGRTLLDAAARAGAQAAGREAGAIAPGMLADLVALDGEHIALAGLEGDALLDGWIFAGDGTAVTDLWSAGRHIVRGGRHVARAAVETRFRLRLARLRSVL